MALREVKGGFVGELSAMRKRKSVPVKPPDLLIKARHPNTSIVIAS